MKKMASHTQETLPELTAEQKIKLARLVGMPDSYIDTSDIPEVTDWSNAVIGKFYRPKKKPVSIRLDMDVYAWFKNRTGKYQTEINKVLRDFMNSHQR